MSGVEWAHVKKPGCEYSERSLGPVCDGRQNYIAASTCPAVTKFGFEAFKKAFHMMITVYSEQGSAMAMIEF
ncbi:hypothetical protein RR48_15488 [Papilio machaon]|uniref:Uncharacterized protein n=1 Tax=Papilio machaon TaxID=76193 RepID=A0A194QV52_PAPMA|nr:hypothetical protein RR48_15488 [Papilio machaon]